MQQQKHLKMCDMEKQLHRLQQKGTSVGTGRVEKCRPSMEVRVSFMFSIVQYVLVHSHPYTFPLDGIQYIRVFIYTEAAQFIFVNNICVKTFIQNRIRKIYSTLCTDDEQLQFQWNVK